MTIAMYSLLVLALILANMPFLTQRGLGVITLKRKTIFHYLIELMIGFVFIAVLAFLLEKRTGSVHHQDWQFYVIVICLYLVFAFPAFVWRYFWHKRHHD